MKTIQRSIAVLIAICSANFCFAQLGLGVTSTTQAAVNVASSTNSVVQTTSAVSNATKSVVNGVATKAIDVTKSTTAIATGTATQTVSNVNVNANVNSNTAVNSNNSNVSASGQTTINTGVNGNTDQTTGQTVQTVKDLRQGVVKEVKTTTQPVKSTITNAKPSVEAASETRSETRVSIPKR